MKAGGQTSLLEGGERQMGGGIRHQTFSCARLKGTNACPLDVVAMHVHAVAFCCTLMHIIAYYRILLNIIGKIEKIG